MKLAATEFSSYALVWWNKLQKERARNEEPMVDTWAEMKSYDYLNFSRASVVQFLVSRYIMHLNRTSE